MGSVGRIYRYEALGVLPNPNSRMNWGKRRSVLAPILRHLGLQINLQHPPAPFPLASVVVTLEYPTTRFMDKDNAYGAVKPLVDALKGRVIVDDSIRHIDLRVEQVKVARADRRAVLVVQEVEELRGEQSNQ